MYFNYPWAYDNNTRDWYWFNTSDTQWIAHMGTGQWAKLQNSALASGWVYFTGNFAFAQGNGAWHYINEADTQWVVNMRTGEWNLFGEIVASVDAVGTWQYPYTDGDGQQQIVSLTLHANGTITGYDGDGDFGTGGTYAVSGNTVSARVVDQGVWGDATGIVAGSSMTLNFAWENGEERTLVFTKQ